MENRTEIGRAIRDRLDNLDKNPNDFVWSKIEKDLNHKRSRRILTWLIPSIIAVAFLLTALFLSFDSQEKKQVQQAQSPKDVNAKKQDLKANKQSNQNSQKQVASPEKTTTITTSKNVTLVKESSKLITSTKDYEEYEVVKKYKVVIKKQHVKNAPLKTTASKKPLQTDAPKNKKTASKPVLAKNKSSQKTKSKNLSQIKKPEAKVPTNFAPEKTGLDTLNHNQIIAKADEIVKDTIAKKDSLIAQNKTTPKRAYKKTTYNAQPDETKPDFSIHAFYGPAIFGSLNGESIISPTMNNFSKSHPITSHYGVYVKTMFDKIGFRVGFSKINLKVATHLDQNLITDYSNINLKPQTNINTTFGNSNEAELLQKLSYYEIPIAFNYAVKKDDSKFGVDTFTGFSFLLLDKNQLYLKSEKVARQEIGEAKNISSLNISYDLGIGITYKLTDKIGLDMNPVFKYYLNTFKENGEAKPYSLSLQTGINYKF